MKALVIGFGVSGKAASAFLKKKGDEVVVVDRLFDFPFQDSEDFPLEGFGLVVVSPGISESHPLLKKAKSMGIEVIGEMELGFRHLQKKAIGITGSNGKTTTVLLTTHILNECNIKAKALGNVGEPLTHYLLEESEDEILVLELSSFQLESLHTKALDYSVILNITPNHLDRHASMQEYADAKKKIQTCLKKNGEFFVSKQVRNEFGFEGTVFENGVDQLNFVEYTKLTMVSLQSVQASYLLCKRCGVTDIDFLRALKSFKKPPHRIEWVAKINGVEYYNDSKSSNIHSVMHAVDQFDGKLLLIVGGLHKGASYAPWIEKFKGKVERIVAYGKAAPIIEYELGKFFSVKRIDSFKSAVEVARNWVMNGETVLLSPGCSSYDQFKSYEHRGNEFKRLLREE